MTGQRNHCSIQLPTLREIAPDLTNITRPRLYVSLVLPFLWCGLYFVFATLRLWPIAALCLVSLSFVTYGSVSHDLVHGNLGLGKRVNGLLLSLIELCWRCAAVMRIGWRICIIMRDFHIRTTLKARRLECRWQERCGRVSSCSPRFGCGRFSARRASGC